MTEIVNDRVDFLTAAGVVRGRRVRIDDFPANDEQKMMDEMLSAYSKRFNVPQGELLMLVDVELILGFGKTNTQPWLILQRSAILGYFTGP